MSKRDSTNVKIAPSILSADLMKLGSEINSVEEAGANYHHIDVMDGHYVPNLTFGLPLVQALKKVTKIPLDVHLMITNPDEMALAYVSAGADILTFQIEASNHPHRTIQTLKSSGVRVGISLNPGSPLELSYPLLNYIDVVMIMSVNPGFGGQIFIEESIQRISCLKRKIAEMSLAHKIQIEVDGGITFQNASRVIEAGADILVAGTAIYGQKSRADAILQLKNA